VIDTTELAEEPEIGARSEFRPRMLASLDRTCEVQRG
jgi:hypothetical protein